MCLVGRRLAGRLRCMKYIFHAQKRVTIGLCERVQLSVVHAQTDSTDLLCYYDYVGSPRRLTLLNNIYVQQLEKVYHLTTVSYFVTFYRAVKW